MPTGATAKPNDDRGPRRAPFRPSRREAATMAPFSWQDGRRLWILERAGLRWTLAELRFEPGCCCYLEVRRASYRWPREAAGAFLARTVASGDGRLAEAAGVLAEWVKRAEIAG
ncbi:MAG: hypothetical protein IT338_02030 [Thermomicrobiales bacterium]|nr:hypothetical protein [Thermomicrobiales bacterium]